MKEKIEGTLTLDGLIEGRSQGNGNLEEKLQEWTQLMASLGLRFNLEVSGNAFSILPDAGPFQTARFRGAPERVIAETLDQLLGLFPPEQRRGIFSTLRSAEVRKGQELQTVYPVGPDGAIQVQTRIVEAKTISPMQPLPAREKITMAAIGLVVAGVLVGGLSLFLDFPGMVRQVLETVRPLDAADITVDARAYGAYFTVEQLGIDSGSSVLVVTVRRSDRYPLGAAGVARLLRETKPNDLKQRLALEALARGYIRCEVFDHHENFLAFTALRVRGLEESEFIELTVPLPPRVRVGRLTLTY